jgi:hypothetical protein
LRNGYPYAAFVSTLNRSGSALAYSTYLAARGSDWGFGIAVDALGHTYVTGMTSAPGFPITAGAFQTAFGGGDDAFVSKFSPGEPPEVTLTPTSLTFASQPVGTISPTQQATLANTGSAELKMSSIGGPSGDFTLDTKCPSGLKAGASCTLNVTFTPTSAGAKLGAVVITDNAPGSPHTLQLRGTATGTGSIILTLSPASLDFGSVAVGSSSDPQTVTVTNNGTVAASLVPPLGLFIRGTNNRDFHLNSQCGMSLAPQASCTATVTFQPTTGGDGQRCLWPGKGQLLLRYR